MYALENTFCIKLVHLWLNRWKLCQESLAEYLHITILPQVSSNQIKIKHLDKIYKMFSGADQNSCWYLGLACLKGARFFNSEVFHACRIYELSLLPCTCSVTIIVTFPTSQCTNQPTILRSVMRLFLTAVIAILHNQKQKHSNKIGRASCRERV